MLGVTELKKDTLIQIDGVPYKVIDYAQKQMGRGGSIVNVKLKNLLDASVIPKTFKGNEKLDSADVSNRSVQFLYKDQDALFFMDSANYEQFSIPHEMMADKVGFLKEGVEVSAQYFDNQIINVELPIKLEFLVTESPDIVKGDTQSTVLKTATLENGTEVQVPIFIKTGDSIVVDTRNGSYVERSKK